MTYNSVFIANLLSLKTFTQASSSIYLKINTQPENILSCWNTYHMSVSEIK